MEQKKQKLLDKAKKILANNWEELSDGSSFTKPSDNLYPFQWNWDSGFIAYGYTHYNLEKAIKEIRSLFKGQWENGFLPHIIFHGNRVNYFPGPDFWDVKRNPLSPKEPRTSGITQPPMHSLVAWHIYKEIKQNNEKDKFLKEFYPKLFALHKYLLTERDPEKWGFVTIYHPWESGFDNSPRWDNALSKVNIDSSIIGSYKRLDIIKDKDPLFRPSNEEYDKYVFLAQNLKKHNYIDKDLYPTHPFKIKDKVFSTILYIANIRLRKMAELLSQDKDIVIIDEWLARFKKHLFIEFWSDEKNKFFDYDLNLNIPIEINGAGSLMPLITGLLSKEQLASMDKLLDKANFCGEGKCVVSLAPSVGIDEEHFKPLTYWRGPIWININWLLWKGFLEVGMIKRADHFKKHMIQLVSNSGFYEYYNPLTGEGIGSDNFSWTAALIIDLLDEHKNHNHNK